MMHTSCMQMLRGKRILITSKHKEEQSMLQWMIRKRRERLINNKKLVVVFNAIIQQYVHVYVPRTYVRMYIVTCICIHSYVLCALYMLDVNVMLKYISNHECSTSFGGVLVLYKGTNCHMRWLKCCSKNKNCA